jgi:gas vesicle protein
MTRLLMLLIGAAVGAGAAYLLDPKCGRRRRTRIVDRTVSTFRSGADQATETAGRAADIAKGALAGATSSLPGRHAKQDGSLVRKVDSLLHRPKALA